MYGKLSSSNVSLNYASHTNHPSSCIILNTMQIIHNKLIYQTNQLYL